MDDDSIRAHISRSRLLQADEVEELSSYDPEPTGDSQMVAESLEDARADGTWLWADYLPEVRAALTELSFGTGVVREEALRTLEGFAEDMAPVAPEATDLLMKRARSLPSGMQSSVVLNWVAEQLRARFGEDPEALADYCIVHAESAGYAWETASEYEQTRSIQDGHRSEAQAEAREAMRRNAPMWRCLRALGDVLRFEYVDLPLPEVTYELVDVITERDPDVGRCFAGLTQTGPSAQSAFEAAAAVYRARAQEPSAVGHSAQGLGTVAAATTSLQASTRSGGATVPGAAFHTPSGVPQPARPAGNSAPGPNSTVL
jgi:hypothetical protein